MGRQLLPVFHKHSLSHIKIRLPVLLNTSKYISEKCDVDGAKRPPKQRHPGLFRRSVSLLHIACIAGGHQIFPTVLSSPAAWKYMIESQVGLAFTILAHMTVPFHNVSPREDNTRIGQANISPKTYHGRVGELVGYGMDLTAGIVVKQFRFLKAEQLHGALYRTDTQGLVVLIEY